MAWESMPKASGGPISPLALTSMMLMSLVEVAREVRVAGTVFNAATYPVGNKETLAGATQWSDNTSSPLDVIMERKDVPISGVNFLVLGQQVYTKLRKHPQIVDAIKGTGAGKVNSSGTVSKEQLAELFEVDAILVGQSRYNTAAKGQTPAYAFAWGKHAALLNINPQMSELGMPTFGFTGQWGTRIAMSNPAPEVGLRGSMYMKVGESVREVISSSQSAYFFENAVA
jgi:hypothetical protein